jgi:NAD(P)-dependent dehydrogenase (short-subunit alcohol dehydrogenase family)
VSILEQEAILGRLQHKTALVTGGTAGIGLATAQRFLAEGARMAVTGASQKGLDEARRALGPDAVIIQSDAGDINGQKAVANAVQKAFGTLDILFINAGVGDFRPLDQFDEAGFDRSFAINLKGPYFPIQALLPMLGKPASIILNTSINAHIGMPNSSVYAATKAALLSLAKTLSGELINRGVRVNAVSPGPIATALHGKIGMDAEAIKGLTEQIPVGRRGYPEEIAEAVLFLASEAGAFTVGSEFVIDGGMSTL